MYDLLRSWCTLTTVYMYMYKSVMLRYTMIQYIVQHILYSVLYIV